MRLSTLHAEVFDEYWGDHERPVAVVVLRFGNFEVKRWRTHHMFDELMYGDNKTEALEAFVAARLSELFDAAIQR